MTFTMTVGNVLGMMGVAFTFASFAMKTMLPLRVLALVSSVCFIGYGYLESLLPGLILNCVLLPVNLHRLWEIRRLSREIGRATQNSPVSDWLLPHMHRRVLKAGDVLFRKGDPADRLVYVSSAELVLGEIGQTVGPGELIGEIGVFSPDRKRTATVVCKTGGEIYEMTDEMIFQLYYQNPKLGFYLVRLVAERLLRDVQRRDNVVPA